MYKQATIANVSIKVIENIFNKFEIELTDNHKAISRLIGLLRKRTIK